MLLLVKSRNDVFFIKFTHFYSKQRIERSLDERTEAQCFRAFNKTTRQILCHFTVSIPFQLMHVSLTSKSTTGLWGIPPAGASGTETLFRGSGSEVLEAVRGSKSYDGASKDIPDV